MKRVLFLIAIAAIALGSALSCSKEINDPEEEIVAEEEKVADVNENEEVFPKEAGELVTWTLKAGTEDTKVTPMNGANKFSWENNDEVKVLYDGGSTTCTASVSDGIATFSPSVPGGISTIYLVYPSDMTASLDGDNLVVGMPSAQKNSLAGYFVARAEKTDEYAVFKHPVCYYKFVVDGDGSDVTRLTLTAQSTNINATSVSIDFSDEEPAVSVSAGGAKTITYDFSGTGTYYIPFVPAATAAADNLTFQFYRGEAKTEKAGAILYGADLANARGTIVDWASLPAMATNRYVSTSGSDANNGATVDKPWSFDKFKAFMENKTANGNTARDAAALALYDGINIRFAAGTYSFSSKISPDIAIKTNLIGADNSSTFFNGGNNNILFDIWKKSNETVTFKNLTFQNATNTSSDGGAFRIGYGDRTFHIAFENCAFINNKANASGKAGGALYVCANTGIDFKNCSFGDGKSSNKNYASQGGVVYLNGTGDSKSGVVKASFTDCIFNYNESTTATGGSCVYSTSTNNVVKLNGCLFKNNIAETRGVIRADNNTLIYMNNVSFTGNSTTASSDPWGLLVQGNNSFVCMNNVTAWNNENSSHVTSNSASFNCDGGFLITNSTFIDYGGQYVIRANDVQESSVWKGYNHLVLCNNILINRSTDKSNSVFWYRKTNSELLTNAGHNVLSNSSLPQGNVTAAESDLLSQSQTTLGGNYSEKWDNDGKYGVYVWTNNLAGFTAATQKNVEDAIKGCTKTMAGVSVGGTAAGSFYAWLSEIGALGKDGRGISRSGSWWPGAYQN